MINIADGRPSFDVTVPDDEMYVGYSGENMVQQRLFSPPATFNSWAFKLDLTLADGSTDIVELTKDGDKLVWDILDRHLVTGKIGGNAITAQIRAENGNTVKKSNLFCFFVCKSVNATEAPPRNPTELQQAEKRIAEAEASCKAAELNAEKAAEQAIFAKNGADSAVELIQEKLDNGEFIGPVGPSGVYVGSGDMPEGYTVQVDPTGDMLCYTAGESDSRYLRATEIRRPFTGGGITLTDADDAAFGGVTVLGATSETGTGDKGPDNPYTLTGVQPTAVTVCGRNLAANMIVEAAPRYIGTIFCDFEPLPNTTYTISLIVPNGESHYSNEHLFTSARAITAESKTLTLTTNAQLSKNDERQYAAGKGWRLFKNNSTTESSGIARDLQIEYGPAATPYAPYTGQTVPLPTLEPLYGDGTVNDEYDAATGVETRRWKRVTLDGTEAWAVSAAGTAGKYRVSLSIEDILPTATFSQVSSCRCSHYATISADNTYHLQVGISANYGTSHGIFIYDDAYDVQDVTGWKAYLAAQYAAGTPVTVVYQLAEPVITRYGPQRIPTYPGCTNLMLDMAAEGAVQYPLSAPMQWDAKADKAAIYDRDTADSRFAGVLTGTACGAVACLEDASPVGPLRRAAVLGATTETGEGDKGPDNPHTIAGVQPTSLTACGRNLLDLSVFTLKSTGSAVYQDGKITVTGANSWAGTALIFDTVFPPAAYCIRMNEANRLISDSDEIPLAAYNEVYDGYGRPYFSNTYMKTLQFTATKPFTVGFICIAGDSVVYPQIEIGSAASPYQPYTGQTITLPTLAPLYGDGTVCDEYDAATGVEIRRWGRMTANGESSFYDCSAFTGVMNTVATLRVRLPVRGTQFGPLVCSHFVNKPVWRQDAEGIYQTEAGGVDVNIAYTRLGIAKEASEQEREAAFAAWLRDNPFSVVYRLEAPAVTRHDPARIQPPAPVCRVFADAGNVDVGYNRDINMAFEQQRAEYLAQITALDARITQLEASATTEPVT